VSAWTLLVNHTVYLSDGTSSLQVQKQKAPWCHTELCYSEVNVQPDVSVNDALTQLKERLLVDAVPVQVREQGSHQRKTLTASRLVLAAGP